jgi:hypothetical protein
MFISLVKKGKGAMFPQLNDENCKTDLEFMANVSEHLNSHKCNHS